MEKKDGRPKKETTGFENSKNKKTTGFENECSKKNLMKMNNVNVECRMNNVNENENAVAEITKYFEENIGLFTQASSELILSYLDEFSSEMIIEAIKISAQRNNRTSRYIAGILNSWSKKGYKVLADIQNEQKKDVKSLIDEIWEE